MHVPPALFEGAGGDGEGWPMRSQQNPIPSNSRRHSRIGIHISEEQTSKSVLPHVMRGTIRRVLGPSGSQRKTNGRSKGGVHEDACKSKIEKSEEGSHSKSVRGFNPELARRKIRGLGKAMSKEGDAKSERDTKIQIDSPSREIVN